MSIATRRETTATSATHSPVTTAAPGRGDVDLPVMTIYASQQGHATIVCSQCGKTKVIQVADFYPLQASLKVKCPCGYRFAITLEVRKFYRKPVWLTGEYYTGARRARMLVQDISKGGLGFRTEHPHALQVNERISVRFRLDDPQGSEVSTLAVVRRVDGSFVGAEFLDVGTYTATNRILGFYLMA